jgi:hypothetical protein
LSRPARPHPARILTAILILSLPTGLLGRTGLPAFLTIPSSLILLTVPLWFSLHRDTDADSVLPSVARAGIILIGLLGLASGLDLSLGAASWLVCVITALIVGVASTRSRPRLGSPMLRVVVALTLILMAVVAARPLKLTLGSDAPAHVSAVLDARETGTLQPPDVFPGAPPDSKDPRFGVAHGLYAILGEWTGATPADTLRWSALFFSPLWFLAHALLLRKLGMGRRTAAAVALLFTLHAGTGRGFGLAAVGFPGSVAQICCAFGLATLIDADSRRRALALAFIALSALIHPFAWWSSTIVLGCYSLLALLQRATRSDARSWMVMAAGSAAAGGLLLIPRLLARGDAAEGLHTQLVQVVFVGDGLFIADPIWVSRWGGTGAILALPALLLLTLLVPAWARRREHLLGMAIAVPVWLISLNPLVAPTIWSWVSYLVVRLGRIVITTWIWATLLGEGVREFRLGGRAAIAGFVLGALGLWGLQQEVSSVALHLRHTQVVNAAGADTHLDEVTQAIAKTDTDWLLAAPRIGYGIRARGGPRLVLPPVAHASPNDRKLMQRLATWRQIHDPNLSTTGLLGELSRFGEVALLIDTGGSAVHDGLRPFAYVPDPARSAALDTRLRELGIPVLTDSDDWSLFDLRGLDAPMPARLPPASVDTEMLARGRAFVVSKCSIANLTVRPGEVVEIELELAATGISTLDPERVFIRVEGEMPAVPTGLAPVSKLWRKLVTERSGRSVRRFGQYVVPADLVVPPSRWPEGRWTQPVRLQIPTWAAAGEYTLQVTVHDWTWHESHDLRDYLQDTDRFSASPVATIRIQN